MNLLFYDYKIYNLLGLPRTAPQDAVEKAFRKRALLLHPDKNPQQRAWAEASFKDLNGARDDWVKFR